MLGGLYLLAEHLVQKLKGEVERLWGRGEGAVMSTCMQGEANSSSRFVIRVSTCGEEERAP